MICMAVIYNSVSEGAREEMKRKAMRKNFWRKLCIFPALLIVLGLCACSKKTEPQTLIRAEKDDELPDKDAGERKETEAEPADKEMLPDVVSQSFSDEAGTSIDVLREEIGGSTAVFGVAYIGCFDSDAADKTGIDFEQWLEATASPLTRYYPFITEIDENHIIGNRGHLYCVIARDHETSLTVSTVDGNRVLYHAANGDPVLLFCNQDGDVQKADTIVTVTDTDGTVYRWEPVLDQTGYPQLLVGDERELLSWDFTPLPDDGFDLEGWFTEGWLGPTAEGLASYDYGTDWWIRTWDNSVEYCLSFYPGENGNYDGEAVLLCFYEGDQTLQAEWRGWWRIETEMDQPSRLYLDLMLLNGADTAAFENAAIVSETYQALVPLSGNYLLLVADEEEVTLPIFPEGIQAVELTLGVG